MEHFDAAFARIAGRFGRVEPRRRARSLLLGLLADVETRSCWQLAEQAGERSPHGMQRLLGEAVWDADAVRDGGPISPTPRRCDLRAALPFRVLFFLLHLGALNCRLPCWTVGVEHAEAAVYDHTITNQNGWIVLRPEAIVDPMTYRVGEIFLAGRQAGSADERWDAVSKD